MVSLLRESNQGQRERPEKKAEKWGGTGFQWRKIFARNKAGLKGLFGLEVSAGYSNVIKHSQGTESILVNNGVSSFFWNSVITSSHSFSALVTLNSFKMQNLHC